MATSSLKGAVQIRTAMNGFIAIYQSQEYVFSTMAELNKWMAALSAGG